MSSRRRVPLEPGAPPPAEMQIEAIELASNFIMKSALKSAKVLSCAETPTEIAPDGAATGRGVRSRGWQGKCRPEQVSGRNSELVDGDVMFDRLASQHCGATQSVHIFRNCENESQHAKATVQKFAVDVAKT